MPTRPVFSVPQEPIGRTALLAPGVQSGPIRPTRSHNYGDRAGVHPIELPRKGKLPSDAYPLVVSLCKEFPWSQKPAVIQSFQIEMDAASRIRVVLPVPGEIRPGPAEKARIRRRWRRREKSEGAVADDTNMSQRAAAALPDEIEMLGLAQVEEARSEVVATIMELGEQGLSDIEIEDELAANRWRRSALRRCSRRRAGRPWRHRSARMEKCSHVAADVDNDC